jgi:hypothetical protein
VEVSGSDEGGDGVAILARRTAFDAQSARRSPGIALACALTLALGAGATTSNPLTCFAV